MDSLILASKSPRRREILSKLNIPYIVFGVDVDERMHREQGVIRNVKSLVIENSKKKAGLAGGSFKKGLVLGVDTIVYFNSRILGKPENEDTAYKYLHMLNGNRHTVYSGITLLNANQGIGYSSCSITEVYFTKMTGEEISRYVESGEWAGKAGGYAIQGTAALYVTGIFGSYYNVMGLPVEELLKLLKRHKYFESPGIFRPVRRF
jgi:septum formation protein